MDEGVQFITFFEKKFKRRGHDSLQQHSLPEWPVEQNMECKFRDFFRSCVLTKNDQDIGLGGRIVAFRRS